MTTTNTSISKTKGRPMLYWEGKKPLEQVQYYPTQLVETIGDNPIQNPTYKDLEKNWSNLLFHGDNKEVLSTLVVNGFRGKVDLIYIDPPFDSKADYVRKVQLRGDKTKLEGAGQTTIEQTQYEDIWKNDTYLQYMYERLILLRELLSEQGSIYLHCDWHKNSHLRLIMDEVFGESNFVNEIVWGYRTGGNSTKFFAQKHDTLFFYAKTSDKIIFNQQKYLSKQKYKYGFGNKHGYELIKIDGEWYKNAICRDVWDDLDAIGTNGRPDDPRLDYPTQKPEALLERIIKASSNPDSIVLDCFIGSGTTAAVSQKLNRRWIGVDMNKGSIQTTIKRIQKITDTNESLLKDTEVKYPHLNHYRVNNYDFQEQSHMVDVVVDKYGIELIKSDNYFDGRLGENLVKIVTFNKPLTLLDIQEVKDELTLRGDEETRDIVLVCNGQELKVEAELATYNRTPINKIIVKDIQQDGVYTHKPAISDVQIDRGSTEVSVIVKNYISPTILQRLSMDKTLFQEHFDDFRSQVDVVLFDLDYNGEVFRIAESDIPKKKTDFVSGEYTFQKSECGQKIAIKIIDMVGEESLIVEGL